MSGGVWAAVSVKEFAGAKQRLSALLTPAQRQALAAAMLQDVLAALSEAPLAGIMVNTVDPEAAALARLFRESQTLRQVLLRYYSALLSQTSRAAACVARHTLRERLCSWLLSVHDRAGTNYLPLTHERISNCLGVRRPGVTEAMRTLQHRRAVGCQRGHVTIKDRGALEEAACECYQSLRREFNVPPSRSHLQVVS